MIKQLYHILYLTVATIIASGCEKDVPISSKDTVPKAVLNAIINCTSDSNSVKLSESVSLFSATEASRIENTNLQLKINNQDKTIKFNAYKNIHSYYRFAEPLSPGDKVEIGGYTSKHGTFSGFDYVPHPAEIVSVNTEWFSGQTDDLSYVRMFIKIKDNPDRKNYYRIVVKEKINMIPEPPVPTWSLLDINVDQEIVFNNISSIGGDDDHPYKIFSDDLFQGKEYTLNVYARKDKPSDGGDLYKDNDPLKNMASPDFVNAPPINILHPTDRTDSV